MDDATRLADEVDSDERAFESAIGGPLISRLHGLLRAVCLYDLSNQAVRDQLQEALVLIEEAMEDEVLLVAMGQCFYVNGTRIRAERSQVPLFTALSAEFDRRRLGGLRFLEGIRAEELGTFMRLMSEHADAERGPRLREVAAGAGIGHIIPVTLEELESAQAESGASEADSHADHRALARRMYQQAVRGAKAAILRTAHAGRPAIRRVRRVVQPIVDSIMKNEYSIVGLTAIKDHDEYTYAHSVNVSILSVAIGHTLGFSRGALANLGVAALLHDVGKLKIPSDVLSKPGSLTDQEWALIRRHPLEGAKTITRMPGLSALTLDALGVCLYHHRRSDGSGYPEVVPGRIAPPMARVVSVADCYDSMTTHRAYRARPFTGYEALRTLVGPDRRLFDPAALWALVQTVGLYPAGTLLQTESGHLVLSLNSDREDLRRPQCRVLAHPGGRHVLEGRPEIWDPMPRHETVAWVVPPEEFEEEVDRLLAA
jgi:HD-GYP domain-containing protein (c-di-GMP phosphodiesterase class II)